MRKRKYLFLIVAKPGTETWEKLGMFLNQSSLEIGSPEDGEYTIGGRKVRDWIVSYSVITRMIGHIKANPFLGATYFEKEGEGDWKPCRLPWLQKKAAKVKAAAKQLKEIGRGKA